ncbi:MAG: type II toxin-antitoxin system RelE/ParE family toxin [Opitutae bacterium]|nr:type II toxin-antitoxin system RelE/ParE family toxin [Opitutae bacterium]
MAFLARKNPAAAERIGLELVDIIFSLDQLPYRGAPVRKRPDLRKLAHRHYLVIYRINPTAALVEIIRIWDNRRDPKRLHLAESATARLLG